MITVSAWVFFGFIVFAAVFGIGAGTLFKIAKGNDDSLDEQ